MSFEVESKVTPLSSSLATHRPRALIVARNRNPIMISTPVATVGR